LLGADFAGSLEVVVVAFSFLSDLSELLDGEVSADEFEALTDDFRA